MYVVPGDYNRKVWQAFVFNYPYNAQYLDVHTSLQLSYIPTIPPITLRTLIKWLSCCSQCRHSKLVRNAEALAPSHWIRYCLSTKSSSEYVSSSLRSTGCPGVLDLSFSAYNNDSAHIARLMQICPVRGLGHCLGLLKADYSLPCLSPLLFLAQLYKRPNVTPGF
jgi:hypothetical protein